MKRGKAYPSGTREKTVGWTDARIDALEMLWGVYGYTHAEIAAALNVTEGSIVNAINVYGVRLTPQAWQARTQRRLYKQRARKPQQ